MSRGSQTRRAANGRHKGPTPRRRVEPTEPESSGRTTAPKVRRYLFRPTWHKWMGALLLIGGFVLFFACLFNVGGIHKYGGHVWYLVGFAIAASSSWWFGLFDPPL